MMSVLKFPKSVPVTDNLYSREMFQLCQKNDFFVILSHLPTSSPPITRRAFSLALKLIDVGAETQGWLYPNHYDQSFVLIMI